MSARTDLAAMLEATFPDWRVIDHDERPTINTLTAMVYVQRVEPSVIPAADRKYTLAVLVMSPKQTGADDELDAALEDVLEAVQTWDYPTVWVGAERVVYADTYEAYQVTYELHTQYVIPDDPEPDAVPDPDAPEE